MLSHRSLNRKLLISSGSYLIIDSINILKDLSELLSRKFDEYYRLILEQKVQSRKKHKIQNDRKRTIDIDCIENSTIILQINHRLRSIFKIDFMCFIHKRHMQFFLMQNYSSNLMFIIDADWSIISAPS